MSSTVFKGAIKAGAISAMFLSDVSNADSDLLILSYAAIGGGGPQVDRDVTAPGGVARVGFTADANGILEVWAVTGQLTDGGRLQVMEDGMLKDDEPVQGSVRWVYSVEV
jgi:hypothetical protein